MTNDRLMFVKQIQVENPYIEREYWIIPNEEVVDETVEEAKKLIPEGWRFKTYYWPRLVIEKDI